jgi:hypothetical protein
MSYCITCERAQSGENLFCSSCGLSSRRPTAQTPVIPRALPERISQYGNVLRLPLLSKSARAQGRALVAAGIIAMIFIGSFHVNDSPTPAGASEPGTGTSTVISLGRPESVRLIPVLYSIPSSEPADPQASARDAIREVILWDASSTDIIFSRLDMLSKGLSDEQLDGLGAFIGDYADEAQDKSLTDCPGDFREAYHRYVSAWSRVADLVKAHPHIPSEDEMKLEILLRTLRGGNVDKAASDASDPLMKYLDRYRAAFNNLLSRSKDIRDLVLRYSAK